MEIDHIVPRHLFKDQAMLNRRLDELGLPADFNLESEENRYCACGQCNGWKGESVLPARQVFLLLKTARERAPLVRQERNRIITERQRGRMLASVGITLSKDPSLRADLLELLGPDPQATLGRRIAPWVSTTEEARVRKLLGAASEALLSWPQEIDGQWIERDEFEAIETALRGERPSLLALLGAPGSGKSAILARVGCKLYDDGHTLLAIKADRIRPSVGTLRDLDESFAVPESLPVLVERLAAESPVTILIDQLDALSELMDTRTERLSALLTLIDRVARIPQVCTVVSCRRFDAEHDLRLRSVFQRSSTKTIELSDLRWEDVSPFLVRNGFKHDSWPSCVKQILCRPQHLKLFTKHFKAGDDHPAFESYQAMLETILQERVARPFGQRAVAALEAISAEMAANEELWIPAAKLERRFPVELIQLREAELVLESTNGARLGFGHQTVFDFLRARSLVTGTRNLFDEVNRRQDGLAVRGELWSAVTYLRNTDFRLYTKELGELLKSSEIRPHIKVLLIEFLGTVDAPSRDEAACLRSLVPSDVLRPHVMRAIGNRKEWFPLMRSAVADCANLGPQAAYQAAWVLGPSLAFDREFGVECLEKWSIDPALDHATFHALGQLKEWDDRTFSILANLLKRMDIDDMWVSQLAQGMSVGRPDLAVRAVRLKLDRDLTKVLSLCKPPTPPPEDASVEEQVRYLLLDSAKKPVEQLLRHHDEWYGLDKVAQNGPAEFIEGLWTWVEAAAREVSERSRRPTSEYPQDHHWRFGEEFSGYLAKALWSAAPLFARSDPKRFTTWVSEAAKSETLSLHKLISEGLSAIAEAEPHAVVDYLVGDPRRLAVGNRFRRSSYNQTLALVKAAGASADDADISRLVSSIEGWQPFAAPENDEATRWNAEARLALFAALPRARLPQRIQSRLEAVDAETYASPDEHEETWRGGFVSGPVSHEQMAAMSDAEVLDVLTQYGDHTPWNAINGTGGSGEIALAFAQFATQNPPRAIGMLYSLSPDKNELAASRGFAAVARSEKVDAEEVIQLARRLLNAGFSSLDFEQDLCWGLVNTAQRRPGLPDDLIQHLKNFVRPATINSETEPEPVDEPKAGKAASILWDRRPGLYPGGNFPPMLATMLGLLRRDPPEYDAWLGILEAHLEIPEDPRVWAGLLEYLRFLTWAERGRAVGFVRRLFRLHPEFTATPAGIRCIAHCHAWLPQDLFDESLRHVREAAWERSQQAIGELLVLRAGLVQEDTRSLARLAELLTMEFTSPIHLGLIYSAAATWTNPRIRDVSHRVLMSAVPSAVGEFGQEIMEALALQAGHVPNDALTAEFLNAVANAANLPLLDNANTVSRRLKELIEDGYSPAEVGTLLRRLVGLADAQLGKIGSQISASTGELMDLALTLQRFPEARSNGTWVFERLVLANAHLIGKAVADLDRRF